MILDLAKRALIHLALAQVHQVVLAVKMIMFLMELLVLHLQDVLLLLLVLLPHALHAKPDTICLEALVDHYQK